MTKSSSSTTPGKCSKPSKGSESVKRESFVFTSPYDIQASITRSGINQASKNNLSKMTPAVCVL